MASFSYNSGNNTVTVTGTTTTLLDDWVAADIAGGWGKITKQGTTQYFATCKLIVGDGTTPTDVSANGKQLTFAAGIRLTPSEKDILVMENATVTFGILQDAATKRTAYGCCLVDLEGTVYGHLIAPNSDSETCQINLFGCHLENLGGQDCWWQATKAYNCLCNGRAYPNISVYVMTPQDYQNIIISGQIGTSGYGIRRPKPTTAINNLFIMATNTKLWFQSNYQSVVKNVWFRGSGFTARMEGVNVDCSVINADDGGVAWTIDWSTGASTGKLYRKYEFDLQVVDNQNDGYPLSGAKVNVYDKNGNPLITEQTTDENGNIPTQTLTRGYYDREHGDTLQDYAPLLLVITKEGYQDYHDEMNPTMKTQYQVSMNRQVGVWVGADGKLAVDVNPSNPVSTINLAL
jgi:hypothetical protein